MAQTNELHQQSLSQLRALAQHHLTEIQADLAQEAAVHTQAESDLQRYAKPSSSIRKRQQQASQPTARRSTSPTTTTTTITPTTATPPTNESKPRFRPFQEILHRLRWDVELRIDEYVVGYLERFEGIKELPARSWVRDFSDEEWIPMHRVRYVKRVSARDDGDGGPEVGVVWDRDRRIDLVSTGGDGGADGDGEDGGESVDGTSVSGGMAI